MPKRKVRFVEHDTGNVSEKVLDDPPVKLTRQTPTKLSAAPPKPKDIPMPIKNRSPIERGKDQLALVDGYFDRVAELRQEHPEYTDAELMAAVDAENPGLADAAKFAPQDDDVQAYRDHQAEVNASRNPYEREWDAAVEELVREGKTEHQATGELMRSRPELFNAANCDDPIQRFVHGADVELRSGRAEDLAVAYQLAKQKLPPEAAAVDMSTLFL